MKRFITLFLMVTTMITFTQKVMAVAPLLETEIQSMQHCDMQDMNMASMVCATEAMNMENCQNNCEMMTVVSVLHFIEDQQTISFQVSQLRYDSPVTPATYHYSETLYRPPFIS